MDEGQSGLDCMPAGGDSDRILASSDHALYRHGEYRGCLLDGFLDEIWIVFGANAFCNRWIGPSSVFGWTELTLRDSTAYKIRVRRPLPP